MKIPRFLFPLVLLALLAAPGCGNDLPDPGSAGPVCCEGDSTSVCPASLECGQGCMRRHIEEGRSLNEERMPLYEALTRGDSLPISRMLIGYETFSLPFADIVDGRAAPWQQEEICLACFEFISMEETPPFRETFEDGPPLLTDFQSRDALKLSQALREAWNQEGFPGLSAALEETLSELEQSPKFHCMLRHILESMLRISNLAPLYDQMAEARGLPSPLEISTMMADLHFVVLGQAVLADNMAAPLQAADVPILCQDVPFIPPLPEDIHCWLGENE